MVGQKAEPASASVKIDAVEIMALRIARLSFVSIGGF
jgi:hypothetical protein